MAKNGGAKCLMSVLGTFKMLKLRLTGFRPKSDFVRLLEADPVCRLYSH